MFPSAFSRYCYGEAAQLWVAFTTGIPAQGDSFMSHSAERERCGASVEEARALGSACVMTGTLGTQYPKGQDNCLRNTVGLEGIRSSLGIGMRMKSQALLSVPNPDSWIIHKHHLASNSFRSCQVLGTRLVANSV